MAKRVSQDHFFVTYLSENEKNKIVLDMLLIFKDVFVITLSL
jgi:hypothetical protein